MREALSKVIASRYIPGCEIFGGYMKGKLMLNCFVLF